MFARRLEMQNNKYKKLPAGIGWLGSLEHMNLRHNLFKSLPGAQLNQSLHLHDSFFLLRGPHSMR